MWQCVWPHSVEDITQDEFWSQEWTLPLDGLDRANAFKDEAVKRCLGEHNDALRAAMGPRAILATKEQIDDILMRLD